MTDSKIISLLEAAFRRRESLLSQTNAFRLVNGLGDDLEGLVLEQYAQHFAAQIFDERWLQEKKALMDFVKNRCHGRYLIIKDRTESSASKQDVFKTEIWIDGISRTVIEEHGLKFEVDLNDTLNSGLFLDMRANRKAVASLAPGCKVLNCFAYSCSFGVYCRAAGAANVVNVDLSAKNLSRGRANYELNQLVPARNELIRADTVEYLQRAGAKENYFDLIILDPPSFSRHGGKNFSVKNDLAGLIEAALKVLNPNGVLFVAANLGGLSHGHLEEMVLGAARGRRIKKIERLGPDKDFPPRGPHCLSALLVNFL